MMFPGPPIQHNGAQGENDHIDASNCNTEHKDRYEKLLNRRRFIFNIMGFTFLWNFIKGETKFRILYNNYLYKVQHKTKWSFSWTDSYKCRMSRLRLGNPSITSENENSTQLICETAEEAVIAIIDHQKHIKRKKEISEDRWVSVIKMNKACDIPKEMQLNILLKSEK